MMLPIAVCTGEPARQRVVIISDQQKGEARILIDGQPVLRVTSQSVIVSGDLVFSGTLLDSDSTR
ncbi:hypothetical protein [Bradyrhizobium sp. 33ap4]|uniref:hypothetical protein n=1 Tax=Bradyrhizobium sp. 33ap4 TaxID=3061630 RepID=UPI00292F43E0|nr:hypothetical protein [Bradyrhizobium sp. 33ap4]